MVAFVGRTRELAVLSRQLTRVERATGEERPGRCLMIRGRRRIGKSRLVERFVDSTRVPWMFFTATTEPVAAQLARFGQDAAMSSLPSRDLLSSARPDDWESALRMLAAALPDDRPSIVVIDELPYLMDAEHTFDGVLQRCWDRFLERKPVLLILIGSDISMMEALNAYGRPFHQRGREMVVGPLNPADLAAMLDLTPAEAFDAALVTGGLPLICTEWEPGTDLWGFLEDSLSDPTSALLVSAERSLAAELPEPVRARHVLHVVGSGERTAANISRATGVAAATLHRSLDTLIEKRLVTGELPVSTRPSKDRRYRIGDPYLRFWLRFLGPYMAEVERGRGDLTVGRVRESWTSWRGRTVEPLVREALARLLPDRGLPAAPVVGGYWTRTNDVEIDIVGADREPIAKELLFVGSIKWLERSPFDEHDAAALMRHRAILTEEPVPTVAVARAGVRAPEVHAAYGPADLITAWPTA